MCCICLYFSLKILSVLKTQWLKKRDICRLFNRSSSTLMPIYLLFPPVKIGTWHHYRCNVARPSVSLKKGYTGIRINVTVYPQLQNTFSTNLKKRPVKLQFTFHSDKVWYIRPFSFSPESKNNNQNQKYPLWSTNDARQRTCTFCKLGSTYKFMIPEIVFPWYCSYNV